MNINVKIVCGYSNKLNSTTLGLGYMEETAYDQ